MKVIYIDTSVLVSVFFEEASRENSHYVKLMNQADEIVSSALLEAEFLSAITREKADVEEGFRLLRQVSLVTPDRSLVAELKQIFAINYVRGADALHLACALFLDPSASEIMFLTADKKQQEIAKKLQFRTSAWASRASSH